MSDTYREVMKLIADPSEFKSGVEAAKQSLRSLYQQIDARPAKDMFGVHPNVIRGLKMQQEEIKKIGDAWVKRLDAEAKARAEAATATLKEAQGRRKRLEEIKREADAEVAALKKVEDARRRSVEARLAERNRRWNRIEAREAVENFRGGSTNWPRNLRIGAGLSTMVGQYNIAGGMYAAANVAQSGGAGAAMSALANPAVAATAAITGLATAIGGLVIYAMDYTKALVNMGTLIGNAGTGADQYRSTLTQANIGIGAVGSKYGVGVTDMASVAKEALSSGVSSSDLKDVLDYTSKLAVATGTDLMVALRSLLPLMNAYGLQTKDLSKATDVLFNAVDVGSFKLDEFASTAGRLFGSAKQAGIGYEEVAKGLASVTRAMGGQTHIATMGFENFIRSITSPRTDRAIEAFQTLGLQFGDNALRGRKFADVIEEIYNKTKGRPSIVRDLFGDEQGERFLNAAMSVIDQLKDIDTSIEAVGTSSTAVGRQMEPLTVQVGKYLTGIANFFKVIGSELDLTLGRLTAATEKAGDLRSMMDNINSRGGVATPEEKSKIDASRTYLDSLFDIKSSTAPVGPSATKARSMSELEASIKSDKELLSSIMSTEAFNAQVQGDSYYSTPTAESFAKQLEIINKRLSETTAEYNKLKAAANASADAAWETMRKGMEEEGSVARDADPSDGRMSSDTIQSMWKKWAEDERKLKKELEDATERALRKEQAGVNDLIGDYMKLYRRRLTLEEETNRKIESAREKHANILRDIQDMSSAQNRAGRKGRRGVDDTVNDAIAARDAAEKAAKSGDMDTAIEHIKRANSLYETARGMADGGYEKQFSGNRKYGYDSLLGGSLQDIANMGLGNQTSNIRGERMASIRGIDRQMGDIKTKSPMVSSFIDQAVAAIRQLDFEVTNNVNVSAKTIIDPVRLKEAVERIAGDEFERRFKAAAEGKPDDSTKGKENTKKEQRTTFEAGGVGWGVDSRGNKITF